MTKALLDAIVFATKPEMTSPGRAGKGRPQVEEALAAAVMSLETLNYMDPPDLEEWFQREGVLSVEDEVKRASNHVCFPEFLSREILVAEDDWIFGGDDAYADLETFMHYVRRKEDCSRLQVCVPPLKTFVMTYCASCTSQCFANT